VPLILYLKDESNFGSDRDAGLDVVRAWSIEQYAWPSSYAVVRTDPAGTPISMGCSKRVDRQRVISGIGERPAVIQSSRLAIVRFLPTGSGCIHTSLSNRFAGQVSGRRTSPAESIRGKEFISARGSA
jgi:hypothetical protein